MAGGAGTRLWPISRHRCPKQFLEIGADNTTFVRITYDRFTGILPPENVLVVTTERYRDLVMNEIPELPAENLIVEPISRNTAPCILYSACVLYKRDPEAVMVVSPADHRIIGREEFSKAIFSSLEYAASGKVLVTLGIKPTRPDINYGYIQVLGGKAACQAPDRIVKVKTFIEKPDADLAKVLVDSGEFLWNSGIFIWRAETIIGEMERYVPEVTNLFSGWKRMIGTRAEEAFITRSYTECQNISIDYAVMEKTDNAWIYPASFDWVDIGSWESLMEVWTKRDGSGNGILAGKTLLMDNENNLFISNQKEKLMAIRGLKDFVVVDTADVLFICPKNDKAIKDFVTESAMPDYEKYR